MTAQALSTCARCRCPIETGDLRCAICGLAVPTEVTRREELEVNVLRCNECGAAVRYDVEVRAPRCGFCASVMHVEGIKDPMEQTERYLPFAISEARAKQSVSRWLHGLGWFRPADLATDATVEKLVPLWWVGWVFDARALVSWTADSNAGSRRSAWAPHSGQVAMDFTDILVPASRGLSDKETFSLTGSYNLATSVDGAPSAEGASNEQFDVQRSSARARIAAAAEGVAAQRVAQNHVPGTAHRNLNVSLLLQELQTSRCAFPAYVLAYRYNEKLFRAVVSGQDDTFILGKAPYSTWKILAALSLGATALAAVIFAIANMSGG